ncbi:MAG: hypothetical protein ACKO34_01120 [Vampirovibrionales bacterium]
MSLTSLPSLPLYAAFPCAKTDAERKQAQAPVETSLQQNKTSTESPRAEVTVTSGSPTTSTVVTTNETPDFWDSQSGVRFQMGDCRGRPHHCLGIMAGLYD